MNGDYPYLRLKELVENDCIQLLSLKLKGLNWRQLNTIDIIFCDISEMTYSDNLVDTLPSNLLYALQSLSGSRKYNPAKHDLLCV